VLRHQLETQNDEIEKLRVQVRVVNPAVSPTKRRRLVLVPPHTTVSITGDNSSSASGERAEAKGGFTFDAIGPVSDSKGTADSQSSAAPESIDDGDLPKVRDPIVPEVQEERVTLTKRQLEERKRLEMQLKAQQKQLKAKDREIRELSTHVQALGKTIEEREREIAELAVEFAFVSDGIENAMHEKEVLTARLKAQCEEPDEVVVDTEELEKLRVELANVQTRYASEIRTKTAEVERLRADAQHGPCQECETLREKLDDARAKIRAVNREAKQRGKLQERNQQLEALLQVSEDGRTDTADLDQQLRNAKNELTVKDGEIENMKVAANARDSEIQDIRRKVEETEKRLRGLPNIEEKYAATINQLKAEQTQITFEMKQKGFVAKGLNERITEAQRTIRELQAQLQRARDEGTSYREDAVYHRTKGEEIQRRTTDQTKAYVREANANVYNLQQQLDEKVRECDVYQKLLSDARRQLAPLAESTIPGLRAQVVKMNAEREELISRVRRVVQFSGYVEQAISVHPESQDASAFCVAFRHLQEELKVFDK
jgi:chromosome segregation ATPase